MPVFRGLDQLPATLAAPVLTVGIFDGVHRGHQRILQTVVAEAAARNGTSLAMTFDPHPARVLAPERAPLLLTTLEQRLGLLEAAGLDATLLLPFTEDLSRLSPRAFVEQMVRARLGAAQMCVGSNFRFGHRQAGDVAVLEELAVEFGFELCVIPPVVVRGQIASSTLIRHFLMSGDVKQAAQLLGRPFSLTGDVQTGEGRGRQLGFPTLNMVPEQECLPARGVYITETIVDGQLHPSATNIGVRPTFDGSHLVVESHLLDFSGQLAPRRIEVRLLERVRPEKRFSSAEELRGRIRRDVERARRFFRQKRTRDQRIHAAR